MADDGARLAGAAGDALDSPRRLLRIAAQTSTLAGRIGDLAAKAPDPDLGYILNDLSVAERHFGEAISDYARANMALDMPAMTTAVDEVTRAGDELRLAQGAVARWTNR